MDTLGTWVLSTSFSAVWICSLCSALHLKCYSYCELFVDQNQSLSLQLSAELYLWMIPVLTLWVFLALTDSVLTDNWICIQLQDREANGVKMGVYSVKAVGVFIWRKSKKEWRLELQPIWRRVVVMGRKKIGELCTTPAEIENENNCLNTIL